MPCTGVLNLPAQEVTHILQTEKRHVGKIHRAISAVSDFQPKICRSGPIWPHPGLYVSVSAFPLPTRGAVSHGQQGHVNG